MADDLAKAAMYAVRAVIEGLRDAGALSEKAIHAIEQRTIYGIHAASAIESAGVGFDADESRALRQGMWWVRECIAPTGDFLPGPVSEHPKHLHEWPTLEQRRASDEE